MSIDYNILAKDYDLTRTANIDTINLFAAELPLDGKTILDFGCGKRLDAHTAYLQVVRDNQKAVNLYTKFGYKTIYSYWYRVKKGELL